MYYFLFYVWSLNHHFPHIYINIFVMEISNIIRLSLKKTSLGVLMPTGSEGLWQEGGKKELERKKETKNLRKI